MKIVQVEPIGISSESKEKLRAKFKDNGHDLIFYNDKPASDHDIIDRASEAEVIILSNLPLKREVMSQCPSLKMISVAFAGVDHIDMEYCREKNILVSNAADYSTYSVAELTVGLILSLYRKIRWSEDQLLKEADRQGFLGHEMYGKTIGIIGFGRIGSKVAEYAKTMGCKVLVYSRSKKQHQKVEFVSLDKLLKQSDIVSVHVPLKQETKGMIGQQQLAKMKPDAIIINTARGPIVDYNALATALEQNKLAGAGIDVYEKEPPIQKDHPLMNVKNTVLLPHVGFATEEAIDRRSKIVIDNILYWLQGKPINEIS